MEIRAGNVPGASFRVQVLPRLDEQLLELERQPGQPEHVRAFQVVRDWQRIAILSGGDTPGGKRYRYFELEPSDTEDSIEWRGFYVRGRFRIVKRLNRLTEPPPEWR